MKKMMNFLKTKKTKIVNKELSPIHLRGLNLGGWLMMEAYFMHAPNRAEQIFKKKFAAALGPTELKEFETNFRASFIQEKDFAQIAKWGFNSLRVSFNRVIPRELAPRLPPEGRARETIGFSNMAFQSNQDSSTANFIEGKQGGLFKSSYNRNRIPRSLLRGAFISVSLTQGSSIG